MFDVWKPQALIGWIFVFAFACHDDSASRKDKDKPTDAISYDGVDILVVVDTSSKMTTAQYQLSTAMYTLVNRLTRPIADASADFVLPASVRVGVVSADMGYQYGEGEPVEFEIPGCSPYGDNGALLQPSELNIAVADDVIECEAAGGQCPDEFDCVAGSCRAPGGVTTVACPPLDGAWLETKVDDVDEASNFHSAAACRMLRGTAGCAVTQPLKAIQKGMEHNRTFAAAGHLLAVLVVTDDDDCSMEKPCFLVDPEDTASPVNASGASYGCATRPELLYSTTGYVDGLIALKNGDAGGVVFAAIAGMPTGMDSPCRGNGTRILEKGCLNAAEMQLSFEPACMRTDAGGTTLIEARPGRRLVDTVQKFGENGYAYSICEADWRPAVTEFADALLKRMTK